VPLRAFAAVETRREWGAWRLLTRRCVVGLSNPPPAAAAAAAAVETRMTKKKKRREEKEKERTGGERGAGVNWLQ